MIKKAVLPVAGLGTRFLPATKGIPKEMLPIVDKPLLQYAVEEAIGIGVEEIIFITSPEKYAIKRHFETDEDLPKRLVKSGKSDFVQKVNPEIFSKVNFHYVIQDEQKGLGHAILQAEKYIEDESFAVLLPDDLFISNKSCLSQLIDIHKDTSSSVIAVNKVDKEDIHRYGVIKPGKINGNSIEIEDIVEKPNPEEAPSDIAVCGRYILSSSIFEHIKSTNFDKTGEIQITDAIRSLLNEEKIYAAIYDGDKFDCGSKKGFVHATISLALRDESIKEDIVNIIKDIV